MRRTLIGAPGRAMDAYRKFRNRHPWIIVLYEPLLVVLIANIFQDSWPSLGRTVDREFYSLVAQVIPVFLLAFLIDHATQTGAIERILRGSRDDPQFGDLMPREGAERMLALRRSLALSAVAAAALGEGIALYSVAARETSTFLLVVSIGALVMIAWELFVSLTFRFRFG
jgi:hypothetical protein